MQGGQEGGEALGEVVNANGQGGKQSHAHQLVMMMGMVVDADFPRLGPGGVGMLEVGQRGVWIVERPSLGFRVGFVRVFGGRNQVVNQADQQHAREEGGDVDP